jgi:hypothetical protein
MRRYALLLLLALPAAAAAQPFLLQPPDLGEAMSRLHRLPRREPPTTERELEQTVVVPERPGQNLVAWFPFDWRYVDVPAPDGGKGGLRLYYYRSAEAQARRALPAIRSAYARLVAEFAYSPTRRIPYILYGTQREFQTSNVFQVSESVLGVTSPLDLKMAVPWFGDHSRFLEVSTHEMVHQFTIQKLTDAAGGDPYASNIQRLPLWFIEGIAEYYTKGGIDPETDEYLRDLVWNPEPSRRYQVLAFAEDRIRGYIPTYKLGQARIAFIAESYGREKIQALMENAELLGDPQGGRDGRGFDALVRRVLGEPIEQVDARWRAWLKRRYFAEYGRVRQDLPLVRELKGLQGEPEAFVATPDGQAILVRTLDRERGHARLWLADLRNPKGAVTVAEDDEPGSESLHPVDYGIMALADGLMAWSAQAGSGDVLTVQRWRRDTKGKLPRLVLGEKRRLEVRTPAGGTFVRIADPTFSPDRAELAFVGVAADGQQDLWVVPVAGGTARRLTDDAFAKRDLAWGADGLYLASDATDHGRYNLFRVDPASGARTRLTTWAADDRHPRPLPASLPARPVEGTAGSPKPAGATTGQPAGSAEGTTGQAQRSAGGTTGQPTGSAEGATGQAQRSAEGTTGQAQRSAEGTTGQIVFSTTAFGKADLAVLEQGAVRPLTDFTTALTWPALAPSGRGLLAITFHGGLFRLVEVPKVAWLAEPAVAVAPPAGAVLPVPEADLPATSVAYQPLDLSNWRPEAGILYGGGSAGGVAGRAAILFDDFLRDQALLVDLALLGSLDYSQALVLYQNRSRRTAWSLGAFHFVQLQVDRADPDLEYFQRDFGVAGALTFPIDRYRRFEVGLTLGGVERYCLTDFGGTSLIACGGYSDRLFEPPPPTPAERTAAWRAENGGVHPIVTPVLRYGLDTVRYDQLTGPLDGGAVLLEVGGGWLPDLGSAHGFVRAELARWWQLAGRANIMLRVAGAGAFSPNEVGRRWERSWWVSSADNLRGYYPFEDSYLVGRNYYVANLELQVPLDAVVRLFFFDQIEGVAALDFGGVFDRAESRPQQFRFSDGTCLFATTRAPDACIERGAWDSRTLTGVLGVNVLLGPILLRLHFGHPYDIGGMRTPALRRGENWVTNLTLRYSFF